jgi:hypothetical protein
MRHELKCWPEYFHAIRSGRKKFELRKDDRGFAIGDLLVLREFIPCVACAGTHRVWDNGDMTDCGCPPPHGRYTDREPIERYIGYIYIGYLCGVGVAALSLLTHDELRRAYPEWTDHEKED